MIEGADKIHLSDEARSAIAKTIYVTDGNKNANDFDRESIQFLGPLAEQRQFRKTYSPFWSAMAGKTVESWVKTRQIERITSFDAWDGSESRPIWNEFSTGPDITNVFPAKVSYFIKINDAPLILMIDSISGGRYGVISTVVSEKYAELGSAVLKDIWDVMSKSNFYKGQVFTADGKFLPRGTLTLDDLFVPKRIRNQILESIYSFFEHKDAYIANKLPFKRGILLTGKPGTGKSLLGKILASHFTDISFVWITPAHLEEPGIFSSLVDFAKIVAPTIFYMEDLDFVGSTRNNPVLGEILAQMDGQVDVDGIMFVATTNHPENLDEALVDRPSRFDCLIKFEYPNENVRRSYLRKLCSRYNIIIPDDELEEIVKKTGDFSPAHLQELMIASVIRSIRIQSLRNDNTAKVTKEIIMDVLSNMKPGEFNVNVRGFTSQKEKDNQDMDEMFDQDSIFGNRSV